MKIRNKSTTAYREPGIEILPKSVASVPDHHGRELLKLYPWLLEEVNEGGAASDKGSDSGAPEERTVPTPKYRRGR